MKIYSITDKEFSVYGRIIDNPFFNHLSSEAEKIAVPETGSAYMASVEAFESEQSLKYFRQFFGQLPTQIGYCWGRNSLLNALEWHKSSEIHCALENMVVLLGDLRDMKNGEYNSSKLQAFEVKKGESIEIYATTLHFCPVKADNGVFKNVVILPKGTNTPLEEETIDKMLIAKNKWLICHSECKKQIDLGRKVGIVGKNLNIDED